jgi:hypothetical protein
MEHCGITEAKPQWELGHPPQETGRAVRGHVGFTLLIVALATAYRLQGEQAAPGEEPVGRQRWRRQLLQQNREKVMVFAQHVYGIFPVAEYSLLLGAQLKQLPPGIGTHQELLARYGLAAYG